MKNLLFSRPVFAFFLLATLISCKKDDKYTIEDKPVSGTVNYTRTEFTILEADPVTQQPMKARISFDGSGTLSDIGEITFVTSFIFDFVAGQGSDFETTYVGTDPGDTFISLEGSSQMTGNMIFVVTETIGEGKGRFEKIEGGGETLVTLVADGNGGSGEVDWIVTF